MHEVSRASGRVSGRPVEERVVKRMIEETTVGSDKPTDT